MTSAHTAPEFLTTPELHQLTGYAHADKQTAWLKFRGIPHRTDGRRVIVSRVHVRDWLEGKTVVISSGVNLAGVK